MAPGPLQPGQGAAHRQHVPRSTQSCLQGVCVWGQGGCLAPLISPPVLPGHQLHAPPASPAGDALGKESPRLLLTHLASRLKCIQHVATCPQHCRVGEFVTQLPALEQTHIPTPSPAGSGGHPRGVPPCMWVCSNKPGQGVTFSSLHTGQKDGGKQAATPAASSTVTDRGKRPWEAFSVPLRPHLAPLPTAPAAGAKPPQLSRGAGKAPQ